MSAPFLPSLNACFNALSAIFLGAGYWHIRRGNYVAHSRMMIYACVSSVLFLMGYLYYHAHAGHVLFKGHGTLRQAYLIILGSHTILAASVPFFVAYLLWRAVRGEFKNHQQVARWALPIWFYVSVTGVLVYFMLYQLPVR